MGNVRTNSERNIEAGVGYLLMRMAKYKRAYESDPLDKKTYNVTVVGGDSLSRIAEKNNTDVDTLKKMNNITGNSIKSGDKLEYIKTINVLLVDSWRDINPVTIKNRYNGTGDPCYIKKLEYALHLLRFRN